VKALEWVLRIAVAGAFVGHGAYGALMNKPAWHDYFGVLGIAPDAMLMSIVGGLEIAIGLLVLAWPAPAFLIALAAWKTLTELLRVPAGEPVWEFIERGANMAAPLALLYIIRENKHDHAYPERRRR
jgi:hypothetical protein